MSKRFKDPVFPITFTEWDGGWPDCIILYNPEFTEDFGPVKKGESFTSVAINFEEATVDVYGDDETVLHSIKIKAIALV